MPVWGCSAVSHYKLAQSQLNAAEIHLGAVLAVVSAIWVRGPWRRAAKCSHETWLQVCEGASARCSFSVRCVSMYFRIFSTIQEGRTKDFSSSNFRSRHPLEQTLRRKIEARGCRPRLILGATIRPGGR